MTTAGGINPYRMTQNPYTMGVPSAGMGVPITGGSPFGVPSQGISPMAASSPMTAPGMFPPQAGGAGQDMLGMLTAMGTMIASTMSMLMQLLPMLLGQGQQQQPGGFAAVQSPGMPSGSIMPTFSPAVSPGGTKATDSQASEKTGRKSPVPAEAPVDSGVDAKETVNGVKATGYYPADDPIEGGFNDMRGKKLNTLQDFLEGKADYVSVAMDNKNTWKYGTEFRIPELEKKYGRKIKFKLVDTGGAFYGKGKKRIDICTRNEKASLDPTINGNLTLQVTKLA